MLSFVLRSSITAAIRSVRRRTASGPMVFPFASGLRLLSALLALRLPAALPLPVVAAVGVLAPARVLPCLVPLLFRRVRGARRQLDDAVRPRQDQVLPVGDDGVVLAEVGVELLVAVAHAEAVRADVRPDDRRVDVATDDARRAEDHAAQVLLPADLPGAGVQGVEVVVLGPDEDARGGPWNRCHRGRGIDLGARRLAPGELAGPLDVAVDAAVEAAEVHAPERDRRRRVDAAAAEEPAALRR